MRALVIKAGPAARKHIEQEGLSPDAVTHMGAAAGGPKGLILNRLDGALFGEWFKSRSQPLLAVGSSIGSWRIACAAQRDPIAAITRMERAYVGQRYGAKPSALEVSDEARKILAQLLGANGVTEILEHPWLKLNIIAARARGWVASEHALQQKTALLGAVFANLLSRRLLGFFFERTVVHSPDTPIALRDDGFRTRSVTLTHNNLVPALLASATIPIVMAPMREVIDVAGSAYLDGGMIDYHMDLPLADHEGLLFLPHFSQTVTTGWLDKFLPWRKPGNLQRTLLVAPSPEFVASLPQQRIPERQDFYRYAGRDDDRIRDWNTCISESQRMADEWMEVVTSGAIAERIEAL